MADDKETYDQREDRQKREMIRVMLTGMALNGLLASPTTDAMAAGDIAVMAVEYADAALSKLEP